MHRGWPGSPHGQPKNKREKREEDARNLKPQDSAHTGERAEEAFDSPGDPPRCFPSRLPGTPAFKNRAGLRTCLLTWPGLARRIPIACGHALTGDASGNAKTYAECPPNGLRLHPDLMVTVGPGAPSGSEGRPAGCSDRTLEVR